MLLYHNTDKVFTTFEPRPCFFSESLEENLGYFVTHPGSTTLIVSPTTELVIGGISVTNHFSNKLFGCDHIYSMFDKRIGEFEPGEVDMIVNEMIQAGFHGTRLEDFKPGDHEEDCVSVVIFRPDLCLQIAFLVKEQDRS